MSTRWSQRAKVGLARKCAHRGAVGPVAAALQGGAGRHHQVVQAGAPAQLHQPRAPAGDQRRIQHDHPGQARGQRGAGEPVRGQQAQVAAERMADQEDPAGVAGGGHGALGQFFDQVRPVQGHRIARIVADPFGPLDPVARRQLLQHHPVDRGRKAVGVGEQQQVGHGGAGARRAVGGRNIPLRTVGR
nr:hypothetical protein [Lysobacter enzymogenes]